MQPITKSDCEKLVRETTPDFDVSKIPLDEPCVYEEMRKGNTIGVFQCESAGMTSLIEKMQPERFSDIATAIALYRPGPMFFIDDYLKNRKNPDFTPSFNGKSPDFIGYYNRKSPDCLFE